MATNEIKKTTARVVPFKFTNTLKSILINA